MESRVASTVGSLTMDLQLAVAHGALDFWAACREVWHATHEQLRWGAQDSRCAQSAAPEPPAQSRQHVAGEPEAGWIAFVQADA